MDKNIRKQFRINEDNFAHLNDYANKTAKSLNSSLNDLIEFHKMNFRKSKF